MRLKTEIQDQSRAEHQNTGSHDGLYPMIPVSLLSVYSPIQVPSRSHPGPIVTGIFFLLIKTLLGARNRLVWTDVTFLKYCFGIKEDHDNVGKWTKLTDLKS